MGHYEEQTSVRRMAARMPYAGFPQIKGIPVYFLALV